ncbi:MAG: replicative DNA helicase [Planctomycetes bacterium]|nr:replicative DNA helicase [Planctomycetota bacterium]
MATEPKTRIPAADTELFNRLPPQSIQSEMGVLGSVLLDSQVLDEVIPILRPDAFYRDAHRKIYRTVLQMYDQGTAGIDTVTVAEQLRSESLLEGVGGPSYLGELIDTVPHAANAKFYARIVHEKFVLRELIRCSTEILRDAYDEQNDPQELLAAAERRVFRIMEDREGSENVQIADILHAAFDRIQERMERGQGMISGLATGYIELDHLTSGLQESELIILAARPSMGKTALAVNIADHVALEENAGALIVSLEQSSLELAERLLCARAEVDGHKLRNGYTSREDRRKLVDVSGVLSQAPLFIDDTPGRDIMQLAAIARRLKRRHDIRLIIVDYLQLIEPDNKRDPRQEQIATVTRRLKHIARELSVPVIVLAQLNRAVEMREGHRPRLADLRESGAIEQDADLVMFLHRPEVYDAQDSPGLAELIIAKQRNGPTGTVRLTFRQNLMKFEDYSGEMDTDNWVPVASQEDSERESPF